jgi:mRNA interferase YafQ
LTIIRTGQFKKDYKLARRQGRNLSILRDIIGKLASGQKLDVKHRDHKLSGSMGNYRELHIQSDWLLIYQIREKEKTLILVRMGSHSELFE